MKSQRGQGPGNRPRTNIIAQRVPEPICVDLSTDRANHIVARAYSEQLGWNLGQQ